MCLTASPHVLKKKCTLVMLHTSLLSYQRAAWLGNKCWPVKALRCDWCASSGSFSQEKSISLTSRLLQHAHAHAHAHTHTNTHAPLEAQSWQLLLPTDKSQNTERGSQLSGQAAAVSSVTKHMFQFAAFCCHLPQEATQRLTQPT